MWANAALRLYTSDDLWGAIEGPLMFLNMCLFASPAAHTTLLVLFAGTYGVIGTQYNFRDDEAQRPSRADKGEFVTSDVWFRGPFPVF